MLSCLSISTNFNSKCVYFFFCSVFNFVGIFNPTICAFIQPAKTLSQKEHVNLLMKWAGLFFIYLHFFPIRFFKYCSDFFFTIHNIDKTMSEKVEKKVIPFNVLCGKMRELQKNFNRNQKNIVLHFKKFIHKHESLKAYTAKGGSNGVNYGRNSYTEFKKKNKDIQLRTRTVIKMN